MAAKLHPEKNGRYKGMPGVRKGIPNRNTQRVFEIIDRLGFDPIETMCYFAMGDVVKLGLMTQKELDKPARQMMIGKRLVHSPSGKERALEMVSITLRANMAVDIANYAYPKRAAVQMVDENGKGVGGVVLYVPENGRRIAREDTNSTETKQ